MRILIKTCFGLWLLTMLSNNIEAKEWRGIVPLQSTRSDVVRILGRTSDSNHFRANYTFERACKIDCVTAFFINKELVAPQTRWRSGSSPVSNFGSASSIFRRQFALPDRRPSRRIRQSGKLFAFSPAFLITEFNDSIALVV